MRERFPLTYDNPFIIQTKWLNTVKPCQGELADVDQNEDMVALLILIRFIKPPEAWILSCFTFPLTGLFLCLSANVKFFH